VDTKKLQAFLKATELGSLTLAARSLNYTQSGMTHLMNALEKEFGLTLLRRGRNGVTLTEAGQALLPLIQDLSSAASALEHTAAQLAGKSVPNIRVGAYTSMAQHWLPEIVKSFQRDHPSVDITIRMESLTTLYEQLKEEELDCVFVSYHPEFMVSAEEWLPLRNDELVAVVPEDYPVKGGLFNVRNFENAAFLMPSSDFDLDIEPIFSAADVHPDIRRSNMDDAAIVSMVEHGLGISVLSELVMRGRQDRVLSLPLTPPAYRELGIAFRPEGVNAQLVDLFVGCARNCTMELYKT